MFDKFIKNLTEQLLQPLPGQEIQLRMAPPFRKKTDPSKLPGYDPKISAVLVLFFPDKSTIRLALILRPAYPGVHSRQVGFPGGKLEDVDEGLVHAALRETEEEIGVPAPSIHIIGRLTELYIPPSNFLVHPFVGYCPHRPAFRPDPNEVEAIVEADLAELMDERSITTKKVTASGTGLEMEVPAYEVQGHVIWGATAMMLSELKELINRSGKYRA
jgi:8-oxo-dGTP pyrophosphatase MutT (NUDIX family)